MTLEERLLRLVTGMLDGCELYLPPFVWSYNGMIANGSVISQVDQEMLFEIILAANYLDIKPLLYVSIGLSIVLSLLADECVAMLAARPLPT